MQRDVKIKAKAGKTKEISTKARPMKAPQRTANRAGGLRASMNRSATKTRVKG